jgi:hypothetical protein
MVLNDVIFNATSWMSYLANYGQTGIVVFTLELGIKVCDL